MKFFITILLLSLLSLSLADELAPELKPANHIDVFREEIIYRFSRLQSFYDLLNAEMRRQRLAHVELVTSIFNEMMRVFGEELDFVRRAFVELDTAFTARVAELGNANACLQGVNTERNQLSSTVSSAVNACARRANATMETQLRDVFYPVFMSAQRQASTIPFMVLNSLSRGNVLSDETQIVDYLVSQYNFVTAQWPSGVQQILDWDTRRFRIEGEFYVEEMIDCLTVPVFNYIVNSARLQFEVEMCQ